MAHFAELDENNTVLRVVVVDNNNLLDESNDEKEDVGVRYLQGILGPDSRWVQTSYNGNFRKVYAGIGFTYDPLNDEFIPPELPTDPVPNETNEDSAPLEPS